MGVAEKRADASFPQALRSCATLIPNFDEINEALLRTPDWRLVGVPGLNNILEFGLIEQQSELRNTARESCRHRRRRFTLWKVTYYSGFASRWSEQCVHNTTTWGFSRPTSSFKRSASCTKHGRGSLANVLEAEGLAVDPKRGNNRG
jgi:hypothetical protein